MSTLDITPTPRVLRTLGDIPFTLWQCIAELVDNSIDAFQESERKGLLITDPRIDITWSTDAVGAADKEITVSDNGPGMSIATLQKAVKAGYTNNDPIGNLGLFGMGFNIATAKIGDHTSVLSLEQDSENWGGIEIDFDALIKAQTFAAPIISAPRQTGDQSGTKIICRNIKPNIIAEAKAKESLIRKQLETIYTPILLTGKIKIFLQGKILKPRKRCVWSDTRYVIYRGEEIPAIKHVDINLGKSYFALERNRYLNPDETAEIDISLSKGEPLPSEIVARDRRLKGWLGIQRFCDTSEFGIDFIRNGRKILIFDKTLFNFENPDTLTNNLEYPVELGSTLGGRIVGELHVDFLIPTYQKNGFDTTDPSWRLVIESIRGAGPLLPQSRTALGLEANNLSPLGQLFNGYRRPDPGTKRLAISNATAKELAKKFFNGEPDFQDDDKWYEIAQEIDQNNSEKSKPLSPVNPGGKASDSPDEYLTPAPTNAQPISAPNPPNGTPGGTSEPPPETTSDEQLKSISSQYQNLSGSYSYNTNKGFDVTAYRLDSGEIKINGNRHACHLVQDGVSCDFFFDPTHSIFLEYPISEKQVLLTLLSERFRIRDQVAQRDVLEALILNHLGDERVNSQRLQERAQSLLTKIREKLPELLGPVFHEAKVLINKAEIESEQLIKRLIADSPSLYDAYDDESEGCEQALLFVGDSTILLLIKNFPELLFDGHLFRMPYKKFSSGSEASQTRLRAMAVSTVTTYLEELVNLFAEQRNSKWQLMRICNTLNYIEEITIK